MAQKKRWSDLTGTQQRLIIASAAVELALTATALVDLARRPANQVRGPKPLWVLACIVQPVGPLTYLVLGRRPVEREAEEATMSDSTPVSAA